jgi:hypothetical protein
MSRKNKERRIRNRRTKFMHIDEPANLINTPITKSLSSEPVPTSTPSAEWRAKGEADPHSNHYDCERAQLTLGKLTDDELANGIYMNYDHEPSIEDTLNRKEGVHRRIVWMTAGKERIRWLSRALVKAQEEAAALRQAMERGALIDLQPAEQDPSVSAMQRLTEALQADSAYAWSWHCNLATPIMDSLKCSPEYANKAGADLMQYLFKIDVRKFEEWHHDEPPALVQNVESAHLEQARAMLEAMKPSKIYDERDRGYIKALSHVTELLPSLLTPPAVNQPRTLDVSFVGGAAPTHYCKGCNALWRRFMNDGAAFWNLRSKQCGKCCDNVEMGDQIAALDIAMTGEERKAISNLLDLLFEVFKTMDDAEEIDDSEHRNRRQYVISSVRHQFLSTVLSKLDALPNHSAQKLDVVDKARLALRRFLPSEWAIAGHVWPTAEGIAPATYVGPELATAAAAGLADADQWEYETVEKGRKSGDVCPPDGEGWERDYSRGRPSEAWDRFDNHEETYWKRRKPKV